MRLSWSSSLRSFWQLSFLLAWFTSFKLRVFGHKSPQQVASPPKIEFLLAFKLVSPLRFVKKKHLFTPRKETLEESYKNSIPHSPSLSSVNLFISKMLYCKQAVAFAFMHSLQKMSSICLTIYVFFLFWYLPWGIVQRLGQQTLDLLIGVRIPVPQPKKNRFLVHGSLFIDKA